MTQNLHDLPYFIRKANIVTASNNGMELNVDYKQLLEAQKNDNILIVDVREQDEISETGKLPGSIHIPSRHLSSVFINSEKCIHVS